MQERIQSMEPSPVTFEQCVCFVSWGDTVVEAGIAVSFLSLAVCGLGTRTTLMLTGV